MSERNHTSIQWPDNICAGYITYGRASNYDGFYLADASHGIPTIGSVSDAIPATIRGQHVRVFNYPGQTEQIAKQLVHRWNAHRDLLGALTASNAKLEALLFDGEAHPLIAANRAAIAKATSPSTPDMEEVSHG